MNMKILILKSFWYGQEGWLPAPFFLWRQDCRRKTSLNEMPKRTHQLGSRCVIAFAAHIIAVIIIRHLLKQTLGKFLSCISLSLHLLMMLVWAKMVPALLSFGLPQMGILMHLNDVWVYFWKLFFSDLRLQLMTSVVFLLQCWSVAENPGSVAWGRVTVLNQSGWTTLVRETCDPVQSRVVMHRGRNGPWGFRFQSFSKWCLASSHRSLVHWIWFQGYSSS